MTAPVCDHCGATVRLEYRSEIMGARWTHDTGPIGRWTCPDASLIDPVTGIRRMATHNGVEWFAADVTVAAPDGSVWNVT